MVSVAARNGRGRANRQSAPDVALQPVGARRRYGLALGGLLLALVCILVFIGLLARASNTTSVFVLSRDLAAGSVVTSDDLTVAEVGVPPGLRVVRESALARIEGRTLAVPVRRGMLLVEDALGPSSELEPGQATVGAALKPGQFPPGLAAGARVSFVDAEDGDAFDGVTAVVVRVDEPDPSSGSSWVVALRVAEARAEAVARSAMAGRLALVEVRPA